MSAFCFGAWSRCRLPPSRGLSSLDKLIPGRAKYLRVNTVCLEQDKVQSWQLGTVCRFNLLHTSARSQWINKDNNSLIKQPKTQAETVVKSISPEAKYFHKALQIDGTKAGFLNALETFKTDDKYRRRNLKFVRVAMEYIDEFELQNDVEVYTAIIDVFPRGKYNTKRFFDTLWSRMDPQILLTLELLTKMEENCVRPDINTYNVCLDVFGKASLPVKKCWRLAYWLAVFEHMNPYKLPAEVYKDKLKLCKAALERINIGDKENLMTYYVEETEGSDQKMFIVGSVMKNQHNVLEKLDTKVPLYVEGPVQMWINQAVEYYYVLKTDKDHSLVAEDDFNKYYWQDYEEGVAIAICMTNKPIPGALLEWISALEKELVGLRDYKIIFNLSKSDDTEDVIHTVPVLEPRRAISGS